MFYLLDKTSRGGGKNPPQSEKSQQEKNMNACRFFFPSTPGSSAWAEDTNPVCVQSSPGALRAWSTWGAPVSPLQPLAQHCPQHKPIRLF